MKRTLITICRALLIACCAVGSDARRPSIQTPLTWKGREANTLTRSIPRDWWTIFGDDTLNDLERRALAANQDLRKAIARVDENRASLGVARADRYPSVNLNSSLERSRNSPYGLQGNIAAGGLVPLEQNLFSASLDAGYELDLWGRVKRSVESAQAQAIVEDTVVCCTTACSTIENPSDVFIIEHPAAKPKDFHNGVLRHYLYCLCPGRWCVCGLQKGRN